MDSLQIIVLAIVQGLTEFLPISSSAHLVLVPIFLRWSDQGLIFDVAVHLGSLIAVLFYFRLEVFRMSVSWVRSLLGGESNQDSRLAWWIIIAAIPVIVVGFCLQSAIASELRNPVVIALASILFGVLLWFADKKALLTRSEASLGLRDVLIIGAFQILALIPGTSRSGITITAGLLLGLSRKAAARFSFLLAIPVIIASGALQTVELFTGAGPVNWVDLLLALVVSAVSATLCIDLFLRLVDRLGMLPFVIYRILLGVVILVVLA